MNKVQKNKYKIEASFDIFVLKAHGTCYKRVLQSPDQHSQGPFKMQLPIGTTPIKHLHSMFNPELHTMHSLEECLRATRRTHLLISEGFRLCNRVLGIQGKHHALNSKPTSRCIHPSTHNQSSSETVYLGTSKRIRYTSCGNTPELSHQYWVTSGLSHHQTCIEEFSMLAASGILEPLRYICDENTSELNSLGHCHNP